jgi:nucleoside-diphosphate-sugar epimerase
LLGQLAELMGCQPNPRFEPARAGDVRHSMADLSKAQKTLNYKVAVEFEQGLAKIVRMAQEGNYLVK